MIGPELAALVEANAWSFGPVATALRVLELTREQGAEPQALWEPLLALCPRMAPLGYWSQALAAGGLRLEGLAKDVERRSQRLAASLVARLGDAPRVLLVGHDLEVDHAWEHDREAGLPRVFRYLLLDGPAGVEPPGAFSHRRVRPSGPTLAPPFTFSQLEEALDWADAVVLAGFVMHRQNLLGPAQLRPLLATARDQVDQVLLCMVHERRLTLGEGAPRRYTEDFRPYLWQPSVTHIVSEWQTGAEGTALGWLPLPVEVLEERFGEEFAQP